jgi:uncharacterized spore protein YtfJ
MRWPVQPRVLSPGLDRGQTLRRSTVRSVDRMPEPGDLITTQSAPKGKGKEGGAMNTQELLDRVAENLSVRRSFGSAYEQDGLLIIPVALVAGGGGGGEGPIKPPAAVTTGAIETAVPAKGAPPDGQPLLGTGGGFGGLVLPVGVYAVKGDQVRWIPAFDATLIVLASLSVVRLFVPLLKNRRRHSV